MMRHSITGGWWLSESLNYFETTFAFSIFSRVLILRWWRWLKTALNVQNKDAWILYSQYHGYWLPVTQGLWPISVSHSFTCLNSSLGLAGESITRKLLSLCLDLFFIILFVQVAFLLLFSVAIFFPYFLMVGLLLQYVALYESRESIKSGCDCKLM